MPEVETAGRSRGARGSAVLASSGLASVREPRRWWQMLKRVLTVAFFLAVAVLLIVQARAVNWSEVSQAIGRMQRSYLVLAALLTVFSFVVYSCYDLIGRRYSGHLLTARQVMTVAFVSYAFNLNMGSLVGGVGFRYRLYSKLGLGNGTITRVLGLSLVTNWIGYLFLAGLAFSSRMLEVPDNWKLGVDALQWMGFAFLAVVASYLALCAFSRRRVRTLRGRPVDVPSFGMASTQLFTGTLNWLTMTSIVYLLLGQKVPFVTVLCVLMVSSVAGIVTHIPAGLGILEAVFVTLLDGQLPAGEVLASLLAYRATYYLFPLVVASAVYAWTEAASRRKRVDKDAQ